MTHSPDEVNQYLQLGWVIVDCKLYDNDSAHPGIWMLGWDHDDDPQEPEIQEGRRDRYVRSLPSLCSEPASKSEEPSLGLALVAVIEREHRIRNQRYRQLLWKRYSCF